MSDYRAGLMLLPSGAVDPRSVANIMLMLRGHPDMVGVLGQHGDRRMILRRPVWEVAAGWAPRELRQTDHYSIHIWLESLGLRMGKQRTVACVRAVCELNSI